MRADERVLVNLPEELLADLVIVRKERRFTTRTEVIRAALSEYIEHFQSKHKKTLPTHEEMPENDYIEQLRAAGMM